MADRAERLWGPRNRASVGRLELRGGGHTEGALRPVTDFNILFNTCLLPGDLDLFILWFAHSFIRFGHFSVHIFECPLFMRH